MIRGESLSGPDRLLAIVIFGLLARLRGRQVVGPHGSRNKARGAAKATRVTRLL
jgi:hypothetical protein